MQGDSKYFGLLPITNLYNNSIAEYLNIENQDLPVLHQLPWQHDAYPLSAHVLQQLPQPRQSTEMALKVKK